MISAPTVLTFKHPDKPKFGIFFNRKNSTIYINNFAYRFIIKYFQKFSKYRLTSLKGCIIMLQLL